MSSPDPLAALTAAYRASLQDEAHVLEQLWAAYLRAPGEATTQQALRAFGHRLAGTSGSYGLDEISAAARAVEDEPAGQLGARVKRLLELLSAKSA